MLTNLPWIRELAIIVDNQEPIVTRLLIDPGVQVMLKWHWSLGGADHIDLTLLYLSNPIGEVQGIRDCR